MLGRTAACLAARRYFAACGSSLIRCRDNPRIQNLSVGDVMTPPTFLQLDESRRFFSSNKPQRTSRKNQNNGVVMNENLIQVLMRQSDAAAGDLMVRLVIDEGPDQPSSIDVVPLREAMETAIDLDVDLIGINLNQDPPVVKAQDYTKLAYKASAKKQTKNDKKSTKEFKFRSGIADNDLNRKVGDIVKYLKKGHSCQLMITANGFNMRTNPGGLQTLIGRIFEQVGDVGICEKGVQNNEDGNRASLVLRPNLKASKQ